MRSTYTFLTTLGLSVALAAGSAVPADAGCTRLGFTVNDYGKDGPTRDAKDLLDKHIAKKMAERGITTYKVGKKDVKCELFLDFIVFDEHTCTAEATVCWDNASSNSAAPVKTKAKSEEPAAEEAAPAAEEAAAPVEESKPDDTAAAPPADEPASDSSAAAESAPPAPPSSAAMEPASSAPAVADPEPSAPAPSAPVAKKPDAPVEIYEQVPAEQVPAE